MFCEICQAQRIKDCRTLLIYKMLKVTEVGNRMVVARGYGRGQLSVSRCIAVFREALRFLHTDQQWRRIPLLKLLGENREERLWNVVTIRHGASFLSIASKYWSSPACTGEKSSLLQWCDRHLAYQLHSRADHK